MLGYTHAPASRLNGTDSFNTVLVVIPSVVVRLEVRRIAFGVPFCSPKSVIFAPLKFASHARGENIGYPHT